MSGQHFPSSSTSSSLPPSLSVVSVQSSAPHYLLTGDFLFASFASLFLFKVEQRISSFYKTLIIKCFTVIVLNIETNCLKVVATHL